MRAYRRVAFDRSGWRMEAVSVDELQRTTDQLLNQVGHWTPARWKGQSEPVYELAQRLADQAADRSGTSRHPVPRVGDHALPDQLRVIVSDYIASDPDPSELAEAVTQLTVVRQHLR
jgi:hypothetical protein